jgi:alpha-tubulin suppressor-like RCC1 family protein
MSPDSTPHSTVTISQIWRAIALVTLLLAGLVTMSLPATADIGETRVDEAEAQLAGALSAGGNHTCAVLTDGSLWCWGANAEGQLGIGTTTPSTSPARVGAATNWRSVSAGTNASTCAVNTLNEVWCWGFNVSGQTGVASATTRVLSPTKITALGTTVASVSTGHTSACALTTTGTVMCWGDNSDGQLGTNVTVGQSTHTPTAVKNLTGTFDAVAVGTTTACALGSDGAVHCWGSDIQGRRGDGGATATATAADPTEVVLANSWDSVIGLAAGPQTNCMILTTGAMRCWGSGHLADSRFVFGSTTTGIATPATAGTPFLGNAMRSVSVGSDFACSVKASDGALICGGRSDHNLSSPPAGTGYLAVSAGSLHACAVNSDQHLTCWGNNSDGRVGNGTTTNPAAPSVVTFGTHGIQTIGFVPSPPSAPASITVEPALASLTVAWTTPASAGSSAIADYEYQYSTDAGANWSTWTSLGTTISPGNIGGLTAGTNYLVQIRAVSADGAGPATQAAAAVSPQVPPGAPTVTATAGELSLTVNWTAPTPTANDPVNSYETRVSSDGGSTWAAWTSQGLATSLALTGLTSGASYQVEVRARNFAGAGPSATTNVITMTPSIAPASQTVTGTVDVALTATAAFTTTNFQGAVTYAVTAGSLPADLTLDTATGVISGTPLASISSTITLTATGATAGTATATMALTIILPPPDSVLRVDAVNGLDAVTLEWFAPTTGEAPTGYEYATSTDGGQNFSAFSAVPATTSTTNGGNETRLTTVISTGLTRGQATMFQVRAINTSGPGPAFPDRSWMSDAVWNQFSPLATAQISDPCDPMNDCEVGSVGPGGGVIVYDHGSNAAWGRYLEAAPAYWHGTSGDPLAAFGCDGTKIDAASGTQAAAIGSAPANTAAILAGCGVAGIAARLAEAHSVTVNGVVIDDWVVPSRGDLVVMVQQRQHLGGWHLGGFSVDHNHYVSSTDFSSSNFYGSNGTKSKISTHFLRPVRYVTGPDAPSAPGLIAREGDGRIDLIWAPPATDGGSAVIEYQYRVSTDAGTTWGVWTSHGLATTLAVTALTNGDGHMVEVRAMTRGGEGPAASTVVVTPTDTPPAQTAVAGTSITPWSPFAIDAPAGTVTYGLVAGSFPSGVSIDSQTGMISGTPSGAVSTSATVSASTATDSMTAVVTFEVSAAPAPPAASDNTSTASGNSSADDSGLDESGTDSSDAVAGSTLITPDRQTQLTAPAGAVKMLVGGELVEVDLVQASAELRAVPPAERTAEQVRELQNLADAMLTQLRVLLGQDATLPVSVRQTAQGAVIIGLVRDPVTGQTIEVPVEHVVLVTGGGLVLMVSGAEGTEPATVAADGVLEIAEGGFVSVLAYGLAPGAIGEVVVMSTPRLIGEFEVASDGGVAEQAMLPEDLGIGAHTVVVTVGDEAASLGFRIVGATAATVDSSLIATLPATGSKTSAGSWAVLLMALGGLAVLIGARRPIVRSR